MEKKTVKAKTPDEALDLAMRELTFPDDRLRMDEIAQELQVFNEKLGVVRWACQWPLHPPEPGIRRCIMGVTRFVTPDKDICVGCRRIWCPVVLNHTPPPCAISDEEYKARQGRPGSIRMITKPVTKKWWQVW